MRLAVVIAMVWPPGRCAGGERRPRQRRLRHRLTSSVAATLRSVRLSALALVTFCVGAAFSPAWVFAQCDDPCANPTLSAEWWAIAQLAFMEDVDQFIRIRNNPGPWLSWMDWSSDGCSGPVFDSLPGVYDFGNECRQHDFGYRNYKRLQSMFPACTRIWNEDLRKLVDDKFLRGMRATCDCCYFDIPPFALSHEWCLEAALAFYGAVRNGGS